MRNNHGFTLLESIIAFLILSVFTALSVNIVTQNSMRLAKVNKTYELINQLDTAIGIIKKDIISGKVKANYKVTTGNGYLWSAGVREITGTVAGVNINNPHAKLYEIDVYVNDVNNEPGIHVTNIFLNGA